MVGAGAMVVHWDTLVQEHLLRWVVCMFFAFVLLLAYVAGPRKDEVQDV